MKQKITGTLPCSTPKHLQSTPATCSIRLTGIVGMLVLLLVPQEELSDAKSMIEEISAKQEEMQQKIEQLQQEKRRESRKVKAK